MTETQLWAATELRNAHLELAVTAPGLTPEQAPLAQTLRQEWAGTPAQLLETVAVATHTPLNLT